VSEKLLRRLVVAARRSAVSYNIVASKAEIADLGLLVSGLVSCEVYKGVGARKLTNLIWFYPKDPLPEIILPFLTGIGSRVHTVIVNRFFSMILPKVMFRRS